MKYFIVAWPDSETRNKVSFNFKLYLLIRTTLRKENMGQRSFKKYFKSYNFSEIFYCGMTMLRNTNLDVFMQCQYTRTISRKKICEIVCLTNIQNFLLWYGQTWYKNRKFLENVFTQKLLYEWKLWDMIILENILGATVL